MMRLATRFAALLPFALVLNACGSAATDRAISVTTAPGGAVCEASRTGSVVGTVARTPSTLKVTPSPQPMLLTCRQDGAAPGLAYLPATGNAARAAGHVGVGGLAFGLAGALTTAVAGTMSGAFHDYPSAVQVALGPVSFGSVEARDAFFNANRAQAEAYFTAWLQQVEGSCPPGDVAFCRLQREPVEKERDEVLAVIEAQRQAAVVGG